MKKNFKRLEQNMIPIYGYEYPFLMSKFQLTQEEYCGILDITLRDLKTREDVYFVEGGPHFPFLGSRYPFLTRQWMMCSNEPDKGQELFGVKKLLKALFSVTGRQFRLPTINEWEYVASNGGKDMNKESKDFQFFNLHEVGQGKPNEMGVYNILENGLELCSVISSYSKVTDVFYIGKGDSVSNYHFEVTDFLSHPQCYLPASIRLVESKIQLNEITERHPDIEDSIIEELEKSHDEYEDWNENWEN